MQPWSRTASAVRWALVIVVAVLSDKVKAVGSTVGMIHTQTSSPYFEAWKAFCHGLAPRIEEAILRKDLKEVGAMAEQSALAMHASAMAAATRSRPGASRSTSTILAPRAALSAAVAAPMPGAAA